MILLQLHVYVRAATIAAPSCISWPCWSGHPAKEVLDVYGEQSLVTLTGEAGLGFVEDPSASTWAPCRRALRG
ncbi:hypothetical protein X740_19090 [Mesorhizobium sp. LNHC221B00]|nr:hypothetical protein X740_19090 [Mesorhizobium sp. LNHC221B00]